MSIYSESMSNTPTEVVDLTPCNNCQFDCDVHGYCKIDAINDVDMQEQYLHDVLKDKGYGGCHLKPQKIKGKYWLILYPYGYGYMLAEKMNIECMVPVVPLKTRYTHGLAGLDMSNCYGKFLEMIDQVSCADEPMRADHIISPEDMFKYCVDHFPETIEHCHEINIHKPAEIINLCNAFHNLGLYMITDADRVTGYISPEELVL